MKCLSGVIREERERFQAGLPPREPQEARRERLPKWAQRELAALDKRLTDLKNELNAQRIVFYGAVTVVEMMAGDLQ